MSSRHSEYHQRGSYSDDCRRRRLEDAGYAQEVDRSKDRKDRRKAEKAAAKRGRIEAHQQWVQRRRVARDQSAFEAEAPSPRRNHVTERGGDAAPRKETPRRKEPAPQVEAPAKKKESAIKTERKTSAKVQERSKKEAKASATTVPAPNSKKKVVAKADQPSHAIFRVDVPAEVVATLRRSINKLTVVNAGLITQEVTAILDGTSRVSGATRANVVQGLIDQVARFCSMDLGPMALASMLAFAGLLRGLQLQHGEVVGADLVEKLCFAIEAHMRDEKEDAAVNLTTVLSQLYLLCGVDATLVASFLSFVLQRDGSSTITESDAACGVALLRACGEKLLKEAPREMEKALTVAKRSASRGGSARLDALVQVMVEVAAGHTRSARRNKAESEAPVEAMIDHLCSALSAQTGTGKHVQRRIVQTASCMSGIDWSSITQADKPPRWYQPGVMATSGEMLEESESLGDDDDDDEEEFDDEDEDEDEETDGSSSSALEDEQDEAAVRAAEVKAIRRDEKAISGQRLTTENKKDIFKIITTSADDLECFSLLMSRDPTYTRFHDVCSVLLQLCCQEKCYNAYYAHVLERFCGAKKTCLKTLQFALWDRFKGIRLDPIDISAYINLATCIASLMESGTYTLSVLRGLDLESTNKSIGLFTRVVLLRLILHLSPQRLTSTFFGGDGFSAHDLSTDTTTFRKCLKTLMENYFVDEAAAQRWIPSFYEPVAVGTPFGNTSTDTTKEEEAKLQQFMKRIQVAYKALKQGIS